MTAAGQFDQPVSCLLSLTAERLTDEIKKLVSERGPRESGRPAAWKTNEIWDISTVFPAP